MQSPNYTDIDGVSKYIYEPWLAPDSVQKAAGCVIGKDYPEPMLDEKDQKNLNLERMKAAFKAGFHGNSPEVLNGTAAGLIAPPNATASSHTGTTETGAKRKAGTDSADKKRTRKEPAKGQKALDGYMRSK